MQEGPGVEGEVVRELRDIRDRVNKLLDLVADSGTSNSDGQQQESKGAEVALHSFLCDNITMIPSSGCGGDCPCSKCGSLGEQRV